jgi:hypothetical protein
MTFVSALWLLLLHAVVGATALPIRDVVRAPSHVVDARFTTRIATAPAVVPEETVRAPLGVANTVLARFERSLPSAGLHALPFAHVAARPGIAGATRRVLRHAGRDAHRLASRGGYLAYYPTAPPALG